MNRKSIRNI